MPRRSNFWKLITQTIHNVIDCSELRPRNTNTQFLHSKACKNPQNKLACDFWNISKTNVKVIFFLLFFIIFFFSFNQLNENNPDNF